MEALNIARTGIDWIDRDHAEIHRLFTMVKRATDGKYWRRARSAHKALVGLVTAHMERELAFMRRNGIELPVDDHAALLRDLVSLYGYLKPGADAGLMLELIRDVEARGAAMIRDQAALAPTLREGGD